MCDILNEKITFNYIPLSILVLSLADCGGKDKPQETASSLGWKGTGN